MCRLLFACCLLVVLGLSSLVSAEPLPVYILAGQSNMQGHAHVRTFAHMGMDPATKPLLDKFVDAAGEPRVYEDVWVSTLGSWREEGAGPLSAKFGADRGGPKVGPELAFGITMHEHHRRPILLIKTAWGGKSLSVDFRPESAGPYKAGLVPDADEKKRQQIVQIEAQRNAVAGTYYRKMIGHVTKVLADIKAVYPAYDAEAGYEVKGFIWFQGASDFGDFTTYADPGGETGYNEHTRLLACLINDVRKETKSPSMQAVVGTVGISGEMETERVRQMEEHHRPWVVKLRDAQAAVAELPEFKGQVAIVRTEDYWDPQLEELQGRWKHIKAKNGELKALKLPRDEYQQRIDAFVKTIYSDQEWELMEKGVSNAAYHYMGSAKIYSQIGEALAEAMIGLEVK
ncbi:MAG: sialate O-acetylesterase [Phycisphaeraceae bacterium]